MRRHHLLRRHPAAPTIPDLNDSNDPGSISPTQPSRGSRTRSEHPVEQAQLQTPPSRETPLGPRDSVPQLLPSSGGTARLHALHNPVTAAQNVLLSIFGRGNGQRHRQQAAAVQVMEEEGLSDHEEAEIEAADEPGDRESHSDGGDTEEEEDEETVETGFPTSLNDVDADGDADEMVGEDFHEGDGMEEQLEEEDEMMQDAGMIASLFVHCGSFAAYTIPRR